MSIASVKATINGTEHTLTYNATTQKYEATLTAPAASSRGLSGGYYPVSITAQDTAGNSTSVNSDTPTLGAALRLVVKEKVAPTITNFSPASNSYITNNKPTITFTLLDNASQTSGYSGIDPSTLQLKLNGVELLMFTEMDTESGLTEITGGYTYSGVPLEAIPDGSCTITVDVSDYDGNAATQASTTFTIDTVAPTLTVDSPVDNFETNQAELNVSGTTSDETSNPIAVTVKVNDGAAEAATVSGSSYSKAVTLALGSNTIEVTATDAAGKSTTVSRTVVYSVTAPVISDVEIEPNPVDGGTTYTISVSVT